MFTRRQFIKSSVGLLAGSYCLPAKPIFATSTKTKAKSVILLWMGGGMAHTETFDPKEFKNFEVGMPLSEINCTFPSIPTSVDDLFISEGLENIAKIMDRGLLLRSLETESLGNVLHSRYQYLWHTGYSPPLTVAAPHMGAWISYLLGERIKGIPAFVEIGQSFEHVEADEIKDFLSAGCLGFNYAPLSIPDPSNAMNIFNANDSSNNFINRLNLYKKLNNEIKNTNQINKGFEDSISNAIDSAYNILKSPILNALDLNKEDLKTRERYGNTKFGNGCLLARRLTESGVRFIEVSSDFIPFESWDTHNNGHERTKDLKQMIDKPVASLILDLEERGLLDETLVILASEFSRDAVLEGKVGKISGFTEKQPENILNKTSWGLHRHFIGASSVVMFGGGIKAGTVYGSTAEKRPCSVIENPVKLIDLHATIYQALGIPADSHVIVDKRPFYITNNGKGKAINAFFT